jgi:hypothetical protein
MVEKRFYVTVGKAYLSKSGKNVVFLVEPWFKGNSFIVFVEDLMELAAGHVDEIKLKSYIVPKEVLRR